MGRALIAFHAFILTVLLSGCVATNEDLRGIYARQTRLEARVERLSQSVESIKRESRTQGDSDQEQEIDKLEDRLNNIEQSYSELSGRLDSMEKKTISSSAQVSQQGDASGIGTASVQPENLLYDEGYRSLSDGNYKEARDQFNLFLANNRNSPQAVDAVYWIAESYYREGKFEEAILEFQKFIDAYPKDDKVPLSYLKQALSLTNIGRTEEAKLFFQTLIDKFPKSDEARIAKEKLRELAVKR